jgi:hypothetical protein
MATLKKDLQALSKQVKAISVKLEKIAKAADKAAAPKAKAKKKAPVKKAVARKKAPTKKAVVKRKAPAKKAVEKKKAPAKKKAGGITAYETVLNVIKKSTKGTTTSQIKAKTRFDDKKIANIIYKAKKQGKIKNKEKGVYVKA